MIQFTEAAEAGEALAHQLTLTGHGGVEVTPGNATRYEVYVTEDGDGGYVVAMPNFGSAYRLPELRGLHYTYLAEKFRCGHPDGEVLAAVLRRCGEALVAQP
jgi:hypothetical protein